MKHTFYFLCLSVFCSFSLFGQDAHFSQFYTTPLLLNPGMTGHIEGKYRLNLNYKRQWVGVQKNGLYNTPAISFDFNARTKKDARHSFGLGLAVVNDLGSSDNRLSNLNAILSGGGHFNIDKNEKHFISLGIGGGISHRRLKQENMTFASQFNGQILDQALPSGEQMENTAFSNIETRVGLVYAAYPSAKTMLKIGGSVMHVAKMKESVYGLSDERPYRYTGHMEMYYSINPKIAIQPYLLFMSQANAMEIVGGSNVHFTFGFDNAFFIGAGYRYNDAAIGTIGLDFKNMRVGLSYDVTTTDLGGVTRGNSDFEISFQYIGISKENAKPILPALRYF